MGKGWLQLTTGGHLTSSMALAPWPVVKPRSILEAARANPVGVRFKELVKLILAMGYRFDHQTGSHAIYERLGFPSLNIQPIKSMAKDYQVRRVIKVIDEYGIEV